MKKDQLLNAPLAADGQPGKSDEKTGIDRRQFIKAAGVGALAISIVPRHVLGGTGFVAPSDKLTLAYVGCGTQGMREILPMLAVPEIQIVAVCDPNRDAVGYRDWSRNGLRDEIRKAINKPDWQPGGENIIPGGREVGKNVVDSFYANIRATDNYKACTAYADYRELLEKEKDLDAVKIMTPDHLHGLFAIAALKRNKHVLMHKPVSNRLLEGKAVIDLARQKTNIVTHLIPWDSNGSMDQVMAWINDGKIGKLKEIHNWTNRPVWPQYPMVPNGMPVPDGLDWNLWLGPEADRPYSSDYTNMVFRGWYDFGGGSMADMGHYSLWTVFNALQLTSPEIVVPNLTHYVGMGDHVPDFVHNDFSFPEGCTVKFKYPANGDRPPVDLFWWDGGIRPTVPEELIAINEDDLPAEGMMFVGEKGKILAGFNVQNPRLFSKKKPEVKATVAPVNSYAHDKMIDALSLFAKSCKAGTQYPGSFSEAEGLTEAVNLYAASLRSQKLLKYDAASRQITNVPEANKYLKREYRTGWDPATI